MKKLYQIFERESEKHDWELVAVTKRKAKANWWLEHQSNRIREWGWKNGQVGMIVTDDQTFLDSLPHNHKMEKVY